MRCGEGFCRFVQVKLAGCLRVMHPHLTISEN